MTFKQSPRRHTGRHASALRRVKRLPFDLKHFHSTSPCWLWRSKTNQCADVGLGDCDTSGLYYSGADDDGEVHCAHHFYGYRANGDGLFTAQIVPRTKKRELPK